MIFAVVASPSVEFSAIVLSTGAEVPHARLEDVAQALREQEVRGPVVFDLLTANGSRSRRFFSADFDGEAFAPQLNFTLVNPDESVRAASAQYIRNNLADFDLTLLTPAMRFLARRGISL